MIKSYYFLSDGGSGDPFAASGQAAAEILRDICPRAAGYVQTRTLDEQLTTDATPFRGVAELWFVDAADALGCAESPERLVPLCRDEAVRVAAVLIGVERIVMRRPEHHLGSFIKGVFPFRRRPDLDVPTFQHTWWHGHGPIAAQTEGAVLYVQCHPLPQCYDGARPPYDGVTELHWPDVGAARRAMSSRQMREDQANDAQRFVEAGSVLLFLAREEAVMLP